MTALRTCAEPLTGGNEISGYSLLKELCFPLLPPLVGIWILSVI